MTKTVLIVDDIAYVRNTLKKIFMEAHYQVVGEAVNGKQAVELYRRYKPNIVTMDVVMPEMSGIEATRKIITLDASACVIVISAMGQENLVMEAVNAGAKDYILKPFRPIDVLKTVEHVLSKAEKTVESRLSRL